MMHNRIVAGIIMVNLFLLSACITETPTIQTTNIPTVFFNPTKAALTPPTIPDTPTPTKTATLSRTFTPRPTLSLSLTPDAFGVSNLEKIDFPTWVNDPAVPVLLIPLGIRIGGNLELQHLSLVHVENGSRFDLPRMDTVGYFWLPDGKTIGLVSKAGVEIMLLDTTSGQISYSTLDPKSTQFIPSSFGNIPNPLMVLDKLQNDYGYLVVGANAKISMDQIYLATIMDDMVTVENLETGEAVELPTGQNDYENIEVNWSPTDSHLVVWQGKARLEEEIGSYTNLGYYTDHRIKVYNFPGGELVGIYDGVSGVEWSPDGTQILYLQRDGSPACIFNLIVATTDCLNEIAIRHGAEVYIGRFQWSPDGEKIAYIHYAFNINDNTQEGGICTFELATQLFECFELNFDEPQEVPLRIQWSPDGRFLVIHSDTSCLGCDYSDNPRIGILSLETGQFFILGGSLYDFGFWRSIHIP